MTDNIKALIADINAYNLSCENSIIINQNEPLSRHTTFRIGGLADLYFIPQNVKSLGYLCELLKKADIRTFFLGNGSNVLFDDTGFRGAVVSTSKLSGISPPYAPAFITMAPPKVPGIPAANSSPVKLFLAASAAALAKIVPAVTVIRLSSSFISSASFPKEMTKPRIP